jgi:putative hydrolase of the HAD superfamily
MWSGVKDEMLRWVIDLRAHGVKTAVLSNMHSDMVGHAKQNFAWLAEFDCVALSSELQMVKPDPEIYQHCLQCLGVAPEEALFLDDRESNVRGAQALGIHSIVVQSPAQLRADLQAIGFEPLPG